MKRRFTEGILSDSYPYMHIHHSIPKVLSFQKFACAPLWMVTLFTYKMILRLREYGAGVSSSKKLDSDYLHDWALLAQIGRFVGSFGKAGATRENGRYPLLGLITYLLRCKRPGKFVLV